MRKRPAPVEPARPARRELPLYEAPPDRGLSSAQVRELREGGWGNDPVESPTKSDRQIIRDNVFTYFNLIFVVLGICLVLVGDFSDLLFEGLVVANTVIGIVQQLRSKRTIEKLSVLSAARVSVIRDGAPAAVAPHELVRGDIAELSSGSQIPADGTVLSGQVQVNEGLLTGEADAVAKPAGAPLLSGSFVISGKCRMRLERVGADAYAARLTLEAKTGGAPAKSEMMRSMDRLIRVIGVALVPIGAALFYNQYAVQELGLRHSVVSMVAALIGMIPEGLFFLTSVALAVSVVRLARNRTLIHDMNAIETLARVDVLCVDKTGTVTSPVMELRETVALDPAGFSADAAADVLGAFYRAQDPDNDTARAVAKAYPNGPAWPVSAVVPFTSASKWSAVTFTGRSTYVLGAPESILGGEFPPLEKQTRAYAEQGCRVLLLAESGGAEEGRLTGVVIPLALLVLENPIRKNAPKTFAYFHEQGVAVKVISGDNPVTVSAVAVQAGIPGGENWVDARELQSDTELTRAARRYTVFGRVAPEQKRKLVRALQAAGHTVAMTGDGVNDVLALKEADCGVAMASGADAARQAAQLVLLDSDFSAMTKVVGEGRRVINNIQRASALYLVKNILSLFLALITLIAGFPYPFIPAQLTLISALTIGVPSFFLALEPNHELVRGRFLHNVLRRAFPGGLTAILTVLLAELFTFTFDLTLQELSTMCVILMAVNGLVVICYAARPLNYPRLILIVSMGAALAVSMLTMGQTFSIYPMSGPAWLVSVVLTALVVPVQMGLEKLFDRCAAAFSGRGGRGRRNTRRAERRRRK